MAAFANSSNYWYVCPHCMTTFLDSANSFTVDLLTQIRANHLDETFKTLQESPWIIFSPCQGLFALIWLSNWSTHYIMPRVHSSCSSPFVRDDYAISDDVHDVVACPTTSWRSSGAWESWSSDAWPRDTAFADAMWSTPRNRGLGFQLCFKNLIPTPRVAGRHSLSNGLAHCWLVVSTKSKRRGVIGDHHLFSTVENKHATN